LYLNITDKDDIILLIIYNTQSDYLLSRDPGGALYVCSCSLHIIVILFKIIYYSLSCHNNTTDKDTI